MKTHKYLLEFDAIFQVCLLKNSVFNLTLVNYCIDCNLVSVWLGGQVVKMLDLRPVGRGFESWPPLC